MTFPQTALPITTELYLNGAWTDISPDVYTRDRIRISRGRPDESRQVDAGRCSLTLNNRTRKYSPRNPTGPYYGQIGRNTPIRVSVNAGSSYLAMPGGTTPGVGASTPDAAALDITGDIDVRIDLTMSNWVTSGVLSAVDLCGKYVTGTNQRSWFLQQRNGFPYLEWSPDGITTVQVSATIPPVVPVGGRQAWRATLDVNNGSGGYTVTFYTAPTIAGPWAQLEQVVTTSGTTSIFNSTSSLRVGDATDLTFARPNGAIYAFQLRNGIGGTLVANPDFTVQTPGAASFVDSTGKTWTVGTGTTISNRKVRFVGEVPAWPVKADTSGMDAYIQIEAAGILRRLGQGSSPLQSAMRREFGNAARTGIVAYWPCEDGSAAVSFASAHAGESPMVVSGSVNPATFSGWSASDPLPTFTTTTAIVRGSVVPYAATDWAFLRTFVFIPTAVASSVRLLSFTTTGTARTWTLFLDPSGLTLKAYDVEGTEILNSGALFDLIGQPRQFGVELTRNGTGIDWRIIVFFIEDGLTNASITGTLASRTIGSVTQVRIGEDGGLDGISFGHVAVANTATAYQSTGNAILGWAGETASARIARLGLEELVPVSVYAPGTEPLGAQRSQTLLTVLQEAAAADHGILGEARNSTSLVYWDRVGLYNQGATATLNYPTKGHIQPPLDPVDDDQNVRNDITVTRIGGSSGRYTQTTGRMSVSDPPAGVGRYPDTPSLSLFAEGQAVQHASWLAHLGTVDEARYPAVNVSLQAAPSLIDAVAALDTGARLQITNPSSRYAPGAIDVIVQSYSETISQYQWDITFNCTPASPYTVGVVEDTVLGRADTDGSQLASGMTSTATSMSVAVTAGPLWITTASNPSDFPFDVLVGGERMTVTGVTGASSPQTFTVTRSVNGVVKAQTSATDVRLFQPTIVAL
ncbi:hypothetical protein [Streptomyces violascens]|uniref:Minor tail protein n=1 Tax=Streptomyces violascens TaxID=67381 RepID=A0ABQ3QXB7_9ACTN|nr:hypothetical protein [Streptomyces violascens]GGU13316.1 hypothetical protein GCM10010289_38750 [Streptomyces violascens]GHI41925.1 hypothetical protein Sviol_63330 [Streptomyces violascens]